MTDQLPALVSQPPTTNDEPLFRLTMRFGFAFVRHYGMCSPNMNYGYADRRARREGDRMTILDELTLVECIKCKTSVPAPEILNGVCRACPPLKLEKKS